MYRDIRAHSGHQSPQLCSRGEDEKEVPEIQGSCSRSARGMPLVGG